MRTLNDVLRLPETEVHRRSLSDVAQAREGAATGCGTPEVIQWSKAERPSAVGRAIRWTGYLAFAQSVVFLAVWLLVCAWAGAEEVKQPLYAPTMQVSTYAPTKSRNPFIKTKASLIETKGTGELPLDLHLEGILYSASNPSAIVNGQLLLLNKNVTVKSNGESVTIRATDITRQRVLLDVQGKSVELRLPDAKARAQAQTN